MSEADTETHSRYVRARDALIRDMLLDAARDQLDLRPWADITLDAIVADAGIGRSQVYRVFGSRAALAHALVEREYARLVDLIDVSINENAATPPEAIAAALAAYTTVLTENAVARAIAATDVDQELATALVATLVDAGQDPVIGLRTTLCACWPALDRDRAGVLAEVLVRVGVSYALHPDTKGTSHRAISRVLGAFVEQTEGAAPRVGTTIAPGPNLVEHPLAARTHPRWAPAASGDGEPHGGSLPPAA